MSGIETGGQEPAFAAFVGIDWADQKHVWCLQGQDSTKREGGELEHAVETHFSAERKKIIRLGHVRPADYEFTKVNSSSLTSFSFNDV